MNIPSIKDHSGNKYIRKIYSCVEPGKFVEADVYEVIDAFNVTCPAISHAIKKLLCTGVRGKGTKLQDLKEAIDAMYRAVQKEEVKQQVVEVGNPYAQVFGIQIPKEATQKIEEVEERKNIHPFYVATVHDKNDPLVGELLGYVVKQGMYQVKSFMAHNHGVGKTWEMLKEEAQKYADKENEKLGVKI